MLVHVKIPVKSTWAPHGRAAAPCAQCVVAGTCPLQQDRAPPPGATVDVPVPQLFAPGAVLQRQGQRAEGLMYVKLGLLVVRQRDAAGREIAMGVIGSGDLLGQSAVLGRPSMFTAQAITSVGVCSLPARAWVQAPQRFQSLAVDHLRRALGTLADWGLVARVPRLEQRIAQALRLLAALQPGPVLQLPSQGTLAELLCATRESINRTLRALETRGAVRRLSGARLEVDLAALETLAAAAP